MPEVTLVNFGDNDRVISDASDGFHTIKPGKSAKLTLDKVTHDILIRAMSRHSDPLVVLADDQEVPQSVREVLDLMSVASETSYDVLLASASKIVGMDPHRLRPTRLEIIRMLRDTAIRCSRRSDMSSMVPSQVRAVASAARVALVDSTVHAEDKNPPNSGEEDADETDAPEVAPADAALRKSLDASLGIIDEDQIIAEEDDGSAQEGQDDADAPALDDPEGMGQVPPEAPQADPEPQGGGEAQYYPGTKRKKRRR